MKTQTLNLFIVDDNPLLLLGLQNYLQNRFGTNLNISTFGNGASALQKVDRDTSIVILDYFLEGENGNEVLKSIKKINPETQVIMLSSNEDMGVAIDSFRNGATDYVIKGEKSWKKINSIVYKIITYPIRIMVDEFGINKYIAMFLLTFIAMGLGVYFSLKYIH
jgi:DNA-binding NtrC family response regulator